MNQSNEITIRAICDSDSEKLAQARERTGVSEAYSDYSSMLRDSDLDVVVLGTPIQHHVPQAIDALERDMTVLSEVPAGLTIDECRELVHAWADSDGDYMMAENYIYTKQNQLIKSLVEAGKFGEIYYADGEYIHEGKERHEKYEWRRKWGTGRNGLTYPTHSLGSILSWMSEDRVERVCCAGSGHHYTDSDGNEYELEDTVVMLAETEKNRLIKIRFDNLSERPHAMQNYQLQGTQGAYESSRTGHSGGREEQLDTDKIWLADHEDATESWKYEWMELQQLEDDYLPPLWQEWKDEAEELGHGGSDLILTIDFLDSLRKNDPLPIGIHQSLDMTLPGLATMESIENDGEWVSVPDSRSWDPNATENAN